MKIFKSILFVLLLTPMMGYGQWGVNWVDTSYTKLLNDSLSNLSRRVYIATINNNLKVYKEPNCKEQLTPSEINNLRNSKEMVIQIKDSEFPNDAFALIDTIIQFEFEVNQIERLGYFIVDDKLKAIAPLRLIGETTLEPLFYLKWESVKSFLPLKDAKLIELISSGIHSGKIPTKIANKGWSNEVQYITNAKKLFNDEFTKAFQFLNALQLLNAINRSGKPILFFKDTNFKIPSMVLTHFDTTELNSNEFNANKIYTNLDSVKLSIFEVDIERYNGFVRCNIYKVFKESNEFSSYVDFLIMETVYCKQEDFLPFLPEWLQFLMKDVYIE